MSDPLNRKHWPMKWVVLAIIACVIPYTWITVKYRKPNPAYQPYEDSKQRANVMRLLDAGFRRITVSAIPTAGATAQGDATSGAATPAAAPGGPTEHLADTLVEIPPLPLSYTAVSATAEASPALPYPIEFNYTLDAEDRKRVGGAEIYLREDSLVVLPRLESVKDAPIETTRIVVPANVLKAGRYHVLLAGSEQSRTWTLDVR